MNRFRKKLVANVSTCVHIEGQTDNQMDGKAWIHRTTRVGGSKIALTRQELFIFSITVSKRIISLVLSNIFSEAKWIFLCKHAFCFQAKKPQTRKDKKWRFTQLQEYILTTLLSYLKRPLIKQKLLEWKQKHVKYLWIPSIVIRIINSNFWGKSLIFGSR